LIPFIYVAVKMDDGGVLRWPPWSRWKVIGAEEQLLLAPDRQHWPDVIFGYMSTSSFARFTEWRTLRTQLAVEI